jgi:hypothetical protein
MELLHTIIEVQIERDPQQWAVDLNFIYCKSILKYPLAFDYLAVLVIVALNKVNTMALSPVRNEPEPLKDFNT